VLLVVSPNLAIDRILEVQNFQPTRVQRSRSILSQPGGKGSNVARVYRQLGGDVALVGFVGKANAQQVQGPLRRLGIHIDTVTAYPGESRTCTIVCDPIAQSHPTVVNEESPEIEPAAADRLLAKIQRWIPRVDGVLTTGSLSTGLPDDFYARVLDYARSQGKITAIDASGAALHLGLQAHPAFTKPNTDEFNQLLSLRHVSSVFPLAPHTALTLGTAGAVLIHEGTCLYAPPPRVFSTNPIGSGDAFAAGYLKSLLDRRPAADCLRLAMASAASDASTLRPGFVDLTLVQSLAAEVELRFLGSGPPNRLNSFSNLRDLPLAQKLKHGRS
jgi:tagatose 6-phosphate kinase